MSNSISIPTWALPLIVSLFVGAISYGAAQANAQATAKEVERVEKIVEKPVEKIVEKPVEKIVHKYVEVPVAIQQPKQNVKRESVDKVTIKNNRINKVATLKKLDDLLN